MRRGALHPPEQCPEGRDQTSAGTSRCLDGPALIPGYGRAVWGRSTGSLSARKRGAEGGGGSRAGVGAVLGPRMDRRGPQVSPKSPKQLLAAPSGARTRCRPDQTLRRPAALPPAVLPPVDSLLGVAPLNPKGQAPDHPQPTPGHTSLSQPHRGLREHTLVRTGPAAQDGRAAETGHERTVASGPCLGSHAVRSALGAGAESKRQLSRTLLPPSAPTPQLVWRCVLGPPRQPGSL